MVLPTNYIRSTLVWEHSSMNKEIIRFSYLEDLSNKTSKEQQDIQQLSYVSLHCGKSKERKRIIEIPKLLIQQ